jgi:hypothetical protein
MIEALVAPDSHTNRQRHATRTVDRADQQTTLILQVDANPKYYTQLQPCGAYNTAPPRHTDARIWKTEVLRVPALCHLILTGTHRTCHLQGAMCKSGRHGLLNTWRGKAPFWSLSQERPGKCPGTLVERIHLCSSQLPLVCTQQSPLPLINHKGGRFSHVVAAAGFAFSCLQFVPAAVCMCSVVLLESCWLAACAALPALARWLNSGPLASADAVPQILRCRRRSHWQDVSPHLVHAEPLRRRICTLHAS